ncbi:amidohydrolase family protein [Luteimonas marina]|uniref:Amidohydrolase family protein n=2 Tax=Luteimonas marina TaxID=488485 RepID=A0A5C5UA28_9GAMM|nr:amidohydrolase family protein [Luteimonas marina]
MRVPAFLSPALLAACLLAASPAAPAADADPYASRYVPAAAPPTLFAGATVLDGIGARLNGHDVLVENGRITAIGRDLPRRPGVRVVEAGGAWLTPGLIDVHTHLGTFPQPYEHGSHAFADVTETSRSQTPDVWIEYAVRAGDPAFLHALAAGVTTLQVLPGSSSVIAGRGVVLKPVPAATVADMKFPGAPQGLKLACGSNPSLSGNGRPGFPDSRMGVIGELRATLAKARARMRAGGRDPAPDLAQDTLALALRGELPVHVHCYRADDIATVLAVADEFGLPIAAVHHATEAYKIAGLLREHGTCAAVWSDWWGFKREAEDGIRENAAFVDAAGGCAILHSDIPVLGNLLNLEAAKAAAAGRRAGLDIPPERAIRWITSNAAQALGLGDRIGRIARGYGADLVLWSGDPLSVRSRPRLVMIDGVVQVEDGARPLADFELGRAVMGQGR